MYVKHHVWLQGSATPQQSTAPTPVWSYNSDGDLKLGGSGVYTIAPAEYKKVLKAAVQKESDQNRGAKLAVGFLPFVFTKNELASQNVSGHTLINKKLAPIPKLNRDALNAIFRQEKLQL